MKHPTTSATPKSTPNPLFGLLEAARAMETRLEAVMDAVGLSMAKFGVLKTLAAAKEPVTLTELASCQRCVRSNITQLIDRLEGDGLVKRLDDPTDRRSIRAAMTPLGRERYGAGEKALAVLMQDVANVVSFEDRQALGRLFSALK